MKYLDDFEKDILKSVENGEWKSKNNKEREIKRVAILHKKLEKKKAIYLRLSENDIYELRKKLYKTLSPYETLYKCLFINL